jgi:hypothetical protein
MCEGMSRGFVIQGMLNRVIILIPVLTTFNLVEFTGPLNQSIGPGNCSGWSCHSFDTTANFVWSEDGEGDFCNILTVRCNAFSN